jgi:hypothetical protein
MSASPANPPSSDSNPGKSFGALLSCTLQDAINGIYLSSPCCAGSRPVIDTDEQHYFHAAAKANYYCTAADIESTDFRTYYHCAATNNHFHFEDYYHSSATNANHHSHFKDDDIYLWSRPYCSHEYHYRNTNSEP